jgi:hypothetical protein
MIYAKAPDDVSGLYIWWPVQQNLSLLNKTPHTTGNTALSNMSSTTSYVSLLANCANSIDVVRHTLASAWMLGLILGVGYHFTCQFPQHLDVSTCMYVFTAANCFFMIANILTGHVSNAQLI